MPLDNAEVVRHFINGLARWEQVALMLINSPANLAEFIRIRVLEDIGVTHIGDVVPTSPQPLFSYTRSKMIAIMITKEDYLNILRRTINYIIIQNN